MVSAPDPAPLLRRYMVEHHIRGRGIRDPALLDAMDRIPRELFVPEPLRPAAYEDRALEIGAGQTISQPFIVAYMTARLGVAPSHRVLEIGTGSGYQAAILSLLCRTVYTVESVPALARAARERLERLGITNCHFRIADGTAGWPEAAPFDRIMVTAATPRIPQPLVEQLPVGGRMILPVGGEREQRLVVVDRLEHRYIETVLLGCRFVKLLGAHGWEPTTPAAPPAQENA